MPERLTSSGSAVGDEPEQALSAVSASTGQSLVVLCSVLDDAVAKRFAGVEQFGRSTAGIEVARVTIDM